MDIQTSKIELIKAILSIENESVLNRLRDILLTGKKDFWLELSDSEKEEINLGLKQIESGETVDWETVLKRVS